MQDEKKNHASGDGKQEKQRQPKRHGYFMTPPDKAQATSASDASQQNSKLQGKAQDNQSKNEQNFAQNQSKRSNKPHKKNNAQKAGNQQNESPSPKAEELNKPQASTQAPANEKKQNEAGTTAPKKKNNRHKKKNKSNSAPQTPNAETVEKQAKPLTKTSDKSKTRTSLKEQKPISTHSADDYEEYKFTPDLSDDNAPKKSQKPQEDPNAPKTEVVGVRFKSSGKVYYFAPNGRTFKKGSNAIVDTARGQEFGEIALANSFVNTSDIVPPLRSVIRSATTADVEHHKANKYKEDEAFKICNEKIAEHKLEMKLIDAQYTFDNSKLLFYFTSSERVDFRELVKDLASVFRTRIELRQIGIRDEAKIMGGLGMCGRPLCCTLFLSDFDQVSIKMAKEQNLSLNSAKISGICGRLMCCLKYEHEAYEYEIKRTPPVDSLVRTENGDGIVTEISPLQGTVKVRLLASPDVPPKSYHRDNVTMLRKKQDK